MRNICHGFTFDYHPLLLAACTVISTTLWTGSNHYGIAGFYSLQAMEAGLLVSITGDYICDSIIDIIYIYIILG